MGEPSVMRFHVRNLDCAACGLKIEEGLKRMAGVEAASLDFAGRTLHIRSRSETAVPDMVRRINPAVDLVPKRAGQTERAEEPAFRLGRELLVILAAVCLFGLHLLLFPVLRGTPWAGWDFGLILAAYLLAGWNVLAGAFHTLLRRGFFDENVLMAVATLGALAINALSEAVGVMVFYKVGEMLQGLAVSRSRRSIAELLAARPDRATLQTPLGPESVSPEAVSVGEVILVKPGEKIPLDGTVLTGSSQLDNSPLTGESRPVTVTPGAKVMAGALNLSGALTVQVTKPFAESSIVRILDLVQHAAARKARTESFISAFARYYTPAVVGIAALIALLPPLLLPQAAFQTWLYRALVLLVISCPCALVISIPLGYFGGIGRASRRGILVKGSHFMDALAGVTRVVFDKTGTLTEGVFEVAAVVPAEGYGSHEILAVAAAAEHHSGHPIGRSIRRAFARQGDQGNRRRQISPGSITDHADIAGRGVRAICDGREVLVGNAALMEEAQILHPPCTTGGTMVHVGIDGRYAGHIHIGDRLKAGAREAVDLLRRIGVQEITMLTGDSRCAAEGVAGELKLDRFEAELLPEEKVRHLEAVVADTPAGGKVAYVGDGINDAPVLARADVGVAMGALGTDAAIETADVVLMDDSPAKIAEAIGIARRTRRIVWQNIGLALSVKLVFITFGAFGMATMWEAVFADMGTAVAAVLNATRALGAPAGRRET